jgi:pimeloyl-ACP methyl ester carboxylesterase
MNHRNLLLIPGLLCTARLWRDQIDALKDDFTIQMADHHLDDNLPDIARRILDHAPATFSLAGLSMGGYIAFEIWRQAPERVERLALLDTRATKDSPDETVRRKDLLALADRGKFTGISERLMPLFIHADRLRDTGLTAAIVQMAADIGKEGFIRQTKALMARPDARALCKTINVPTLVLCGRQDALTPVAMHEEIASLIPEADLQIIEDCGHLSTMETPTAVNAAMRNWLNA